MSISLNIAENTLRARLHDQYAFDLNARTIKQIINISLAPCVFSMAALLGGENGKDILNDLSQRSPNPFMRFSAFKALAGIFAETEDYCQEMAGALRDDSMMVSEWARQHIAHVRSAAD